MAGLRTHWAELDKYAPILVVRGPTSAHWAQHADVLVAESGLIVARLFAPYAKQSQPAPGTVWPPPPATSAPTYPPPASS